MRFVPITCLREGMILGKPLYGDNCGLLLGAGVVLNKIYIDSIKRLNYNGIYIEDDLSQDIEISNIISDNLRKDTIKAIKNTFISGEKGVNRYIKIDNLCKYIDNIIDEIISNKNLMVNIIDLKVFDDYTYYHSVNVTVLSIVLGVSLGLDRTELFNLGIGALLHDIGKVYVDKEILNKNGKLTDEEFKQMKEHTLIGFKHVKENFDIPFKSCVGILEHHEKFNGEGYPIGKKGNKISLFGRIISIADVYDALTSDRPYRKALLPSEAMEYIMGASGVLFDAELVMLFTRKVAPYPVGTCVVLSNGYVGIVLENYENCCLRPKLRIFMKNNTVVPTFEINLMEEYIYNNLTIIDLAKTAN